MHVTSSPLDWYAARAAGIGAYVLLSFVVVLGLTMARNARLRRWPKYALEDVHRFAGLLVGAFLIIHVLTIAIDAWLPFSFASIVLPFVSRYRPVWVAFGIVAAELLLALAIANHYRDRLPYRFWRRTHYLNFAVWTLATIHGITSGTDRSAPWLLALYALSSAAVGATTVWRFGRSGLPVGRSAPGVAFAGAALATLVVGLGVGPFRFHTTSWNSPIFSERLSGRISEVTGVTRGIVSMAGEGTGTQRVLVRADLLVQPGHIERTAFQMEYLPSGTRCTGTVTRAESFGFDAVCRLPDGARRFVSAQWQGTGATRIAGTISARP
jgi:methionine sulfoxide reductase heme-binding subunit